jgi:hypothetical protein
MTPDDLLRQNAIKGLGPVSKRARELLESAPDRFRLRTSAVLFAVVAAVDEWAAKTGARLVALETDAHKPYDFASLVRRLEALEKKVDQ